MYLYDAYVQRPPCRPCASALGLGQPAVSSVVNNQQRVSADAAKILMQLFLSRYPQLTSSWTAATNAAQPSFDPNADFWSYVASSTPPAGAQVNQTVYDQLQSLTQSGLFLVDTKSAQAAVYGQPVDVVYGIAKNAQIAALLAGPGGSLAVLSQTPGAAPAAPKPSAPKPTSNAAPIVAGLSIAAIIALIAASA